MATLSWNSKQEQELRVALVETHASCNWSLAENIHCQWRGVYFCSLCSTSLVYVIQQLQKVHCTKPEVICVDQLQLVLISPLSSQHQVGALFPSSYLLFVIPSQDSLLYFLLFSL
jgi:hypothetical protein